MSKISIIKSNAVIGTDKPAFVPKYLEEEKEETGGEIITLRLNPDDRIILEHLKQLFHYGQDGKVLKISLRIAKNVIQSSLGNEVMLKLSDVRRRRIIEDDKKIIKN